MPCRASSGSASSRGGRAVRAGFWLIAGSVVLRNLGKPLGLRAAADPLAPLRSHGARLRAPVRPLVVELLARAREGRYNRRGPLLRFVRAGTVCFLIALGIDAAQGSLARRPPRHRPARRAPEPFYFATLSAFCSPESTGSATATSRCSSESGAPRRTPGDRPRRAGRRHRSRARLLAADPARPRGARAARRRPRAGRALGVWSSSGATASSGAAPDSRCCARREPRPSRSESPRSARGAGPCWSSGPSSCPARPLLPAQNLWSASAARHAFTIGFLTLLIVGVSFRILPVYSGRRCGHPASPTRRTRCSWRARRMRLLQQPAAFARSSTSSARTWGSPWSSRCASSRST